MSQTSLVISLLCMSLQFAGAWRVSVDGVANLSQALSQTEHGHIQVVVNHSGVVDFEHKAEGHAEHGQIQKVANHSGVRAVREHGHGHNVANVSGTRAVRKASDGIIPVLLIPMVAAKSVPVVIHWVGAVGVPVVWHAIMVGFAACKTEWLKDLAEDAIVGAIDCGAKLAGSPKLNGVSIQNITEAAKNAYTLAEDLYVLYEDGWKELGLTVACDIGWEHLMKVVGKEKFIDWACEAENSDGTNSSGTSAIISPPEVMPTNQPIEIEWCPGLENIAYPEPDDIEKMIQILDKKKGPMWYVTGGTSYGEAMEEVCAQANYQAEDMCLIEPAGPRRDVWFYLGANGAANKDADDNNEGVRMYLQGLTGDLAHNLAPFETSEEAQEAIPELGQAVRLLESSRLVRENVTTTRKDLCAKVHAVNDMVSKLKTLSVPWYYGGPAELSRPRSKL